MRYDTHTHTHTHTHIYIYMYVCMYVIRRLKVNKWKPARPFQIFSFVYGLPFCGKYSSCGKYSACRDDPRLHAYSTCKLRDPRSAVLFSALAASSVCGPVLH